MQIINHLEIDFNNEIGLKKIYSIIPDNIQKELKIFISKHKISNIDYFINKTDNFISTIGPYLKRIKLNTNDYIYTENDDLDEIYFIIKGKIKISYLKNQKENDILIYTKGTYFGELEILFYNERIFKARAIEPVELYTLKFELIEEIFFKQYIDVGTILLDNSNWRKEKLDKILKKFDSAQSKFNIIRKKLLFKKNSFLKNKLDNCMSKLKTNIIQKTTKMKNEKETLNILNNLQKNSYKLCINIYKKVNKIKKRKKIRKFIKNLHLQQEKEIIKIKNNYFHLEEYYNINSNFLKKNFIN